MALLDDVLDVLAGGWAPEGLLNDPPTFYRSRYPHLVPRGEVFFVTFRLWDSLPQHRVRELRADYDADLRILHRLRLPPELHARRVRDARVRHFGRFEHQIERQPYGSQLLRDPHCAKLVVEQLHRYDGERYRLLAYCIMTNHVHILLDMGEQLRKPPPPTPDTEVSDRYVPLSKVLQQIKGASARYINLHRATTGQHVWMKDSYDHWVRDAHRLQVIVDYILRNPVAAGLAASIDDWPFSWHRDCPTPELRDVRAWIDGVHAGLRRGTPAP